MITVRILPPRPTKKPLQAIARAFFLTKIQAATDSRPKQAMDEVHLYSTGMSASAGLWRIESGIKGNHEVMRLFWAGLEAGSIF